MHGEDKSVNLGDIHGTEFRGVMSVDMTNEEIFLLDFWVKLLPERNGGNLKQA